MMRADERSWRLEGCWDGAAFKYLPTSGLCLLRQVSRIHAEVVHAVSVKEA